MLVPKILGVTEFGYWQLFLFYASYVGFCHLGLNDGVYLIIGGQTRQTIDKKSIVSQMIVGTVIEGILSLIICVCVTVFHLGYERSFVLLSIACFILIQNAAYYLGYVLQAINETKAFSYSCIIERVSFFIPLVVLLIVHSKSFEPYVISFNFSSLVQLFYCLYKTKEFFKSGVENIRNAIIDTLNSMRVGIKLMLANIASIMILGIDRFIVDGIWGIETFGKLSLALSLTNFFLAFVSQVSMVLFPALRQSIESQIIKFFINTRDILGILLPIVYIIYFPLIYFLSIWLPQYSDSLKYLSLLLPVCVFDGKMDITCTTLFKVRREEKKLFYINIITLLCSSFGALAGGFIFKSPNFIIFISTLSIMGRSVWSEFYLSKQQFVGLNISVLVGELLLTFLFIFSAQVLNILTGFLVQIITFLVFFILNKNFLSPIKMIYYKK